MTELLEDPDGAPYPEEVQVLLRKVEPVIVEADRDLFRLLLVDALESVVETIRTDERQKLIDAWRKDGRDVMFNRTGDDLNPWDRVKKWLLSFQKEVK